MPVEDPVYCAYIRLPFSYKITSTNEYVLITVFLKVVNDAFIFTFCNFRKAVVNTKSNLHNSEVYI